MTTRTTARRPRAAAAILLAGITAMTCGSCAGQVAGTPTVLAAGSHSSADSATASASPTGTASPTAAGSRSPSATPSASVARSPSPSASPSAVADPPNQAAAPAGKVVALDPGHDGGNGAHPDEINALVPQGFGQYKACDTTGAEAPDGYTEHEFNFQVALLVKSLLEQQGFTVVLTRTNDTGVGPCVDQRAAIGNNAHAAAAVSIHADGGPTDGHGYQLLEAIQSVGGSSVEAASHRLAVALHSTFDQESGLTPSTYVGTNGYEPRDDIAGLNLTTVPKILVECGNMQNSGDLALEESSAGRQHIAKAIADGIVAFLSGN